MLLFTVPLSSSLGFPQLMCQDQLYTPNTYTDPFAAVSIHSSHLKGLLENKMPKFLPQLSPEE